MSVTPEFEKASTRAAESIREAWKTASQDADNFADDEAGWMAERRDLRNALLEVSGELGAALMQPSPSDDAIGRAVELLRVALKKPE
jgi:hypothetical protein